MFWLIVVGVVAFSWGFAAGATHEQYVPLGGKHKNGGHIKPNIAADQAAQLAVQRLAREWEQKFQ